MENTLKLINEFEKRNNLSVSVLIHGDGSGVLLEFFDEERIKQFDDIQELNRFLETGKLKKDIDGRCVSSVDIINEK